MLGTWFPFLDDLELCICGSRHAAARAGIRAAGYSEWGRVVQAKIGFGATFFRQNVSSMISGARLKMLCKCFDKLGCYADVQQMKPTSDSTNVGGKPICHTVPFKTNSLFQKLNSCLAGFGFHLSIVPGSLMRNLAMPMSRFLRVEVLVNIGKQLSFVDPTPIVKAESFVFRTLLHMVESVCAL